jgi:hypothetical protein
MWTRTRTSMLRSMTDRGPGHSHARSLTLNPWSGLLRGKAPPISPRNRYVLRVGHFAHLPVIRISSLVMVGVISGPYWPLWRRLVPPTLPPSCSSLSTASRRLTPNWCAPPPTHTHTCIPSFSNCLPVCLPARPSIRPPGHLQDHPSSPVFTRLPAHSLPSLSTSFLACMLPWLSVNATPPGFLCTALAPTTCSAQRKGRITRLW